jgi:hypothetical protein
MTPEQIAGIRADAEKFREDDIVALCDMAARYAWLRECCWRYPDFDPQPWMLSFQASHDDLDAAIDAAMKEPKA